MQQNVFLLLLIFIELHDNVSYLSFFISLVIVCCQFVKIMTNHSLIK
jgi:hypothetical protein